MNQASCLGDLATLAHHLPQVHLPSLDLQRSSPHSCFPWPQQLVTPMKPTATDLASQLQALLALSREGVLQTVDHRTFAHYDVWLGFSTFLRPRPTCNYAFSQGHQLHNCLSLFFFFLEESIMTPPPHPRMTSTIPFGSWPTDGEHLMYEVSNLQCILWQMFFATATNQGYLVLGIWPHWWCVCPGCRQVPLSDVDQAMDFLIGCYNPMA